MALDEIAKRATAPDKRREVLEQQMKELLQIRNQLVGILTKDGVKKYHNSGLDRIIGSEAIEVDFKGKFEGVDTQVRIYEVVSEWKKPLMVDISSGDVRTSYSMPTKVMESKVYKYDSSGQIIKGENSVFCLGLSQVVEAIQGGQLTMVHE